MKKGTCKFKKLARVFIYPNFLKRLFHSFCASRINNSMLQSKIFSDFLVCFAAIAHFSRIQDFYVS